MTKTIDDLHKNETQQAFFKSTHTVLSENSVDSVDCYIITVVLELPG